MHTVTRQIDTFTGSLVVEISGGGLDCANPGALARGAGYPAGEFEVFGDPTEAVEAAIEIARYWQSQTTDEVGIGTGYTCGATMFFDAEPLTQETFTRLRAWAEAEWSATPKCRRCEVVLGAEKWAMESCPDDFDFCSTNCAENAEAEYA